MFVPGTLPIFNIFFTVEVLINLNISPYHMYDLHTFFFYYFCSVIILDLIYFIYRHFYSLLGLLYYYDLGLFVLLCSISLLTFCMMLTTDCGIENLSYTYNTVKYFTQILLTD